MGLVQLDLWTIKCPQSSYFQQANWPSDELQQTRTRKLVTKTQKYKCMSRTELNTPTAAFVNHFNQLHSSANQVSASYRLQQSLEYQSTYAYKNDYADTNNQ